MFGSDSMATLLPSVSMPGYQQRSRKRTKAGRYTSDITYEELSQYFHLPTEKACQQLGVGLTILKRICRRFGLPRWPYKKPQRAYEDTLNPSYRALQFANDPLAAGHPYAQVAGAAPIQYAAMPQQVHHHHGMPHIRHPSQGSMYDTYPPQQHVEATLSRPQATGVPRPMPCRAGPAHGTLNAATLRALGISAAADTGTPSSGQDDTNRLDLLLSAIDKSESEDNVHDSPSSGNTVSAKAVGHQEVSVPSSPRLQQQQQQQHMPKIPEATATAATTNPQEYLGDVLSRLAGAGDAGEKAAAVSNLVGLLASQPALATQLVQALMNGGGGGGQSNKEPVAAQEPSVQPSISMPAVASYNQLQQAVTVQQHKPEVVQIVRTLPQPSPDAQALALAEMNARVQQLQRVQAQFVASNKNTAAAQPSAAPVSLPAGASADRRADLIAKLQAMQSKMAQRQAALQRISASVASHNPGQADHQANANNNATGVQQAWQMAQQQVPSAEALISERPSSNSGQDAQRADLLYRLLASRLGGSVAS